MEPNLLLRYRDIPGSGQEDEEEPRIEDGSLAPGGMCHSVLLLVPLPRCMICQMPFLAGYHRERLRGGMMSVERDPEDERADWRTPS